MKAKIEAALLADPIKAITELITETEIVATSDEMSIVAMDPSNVAMCIFKLHSSSFQEWDVTEETKIGLNLVNLKTLLKRAKPDDFVSLELKDNQLLVNIGPYKKYTLPTIEIETKAQKIPDLKFRAKLTMPTSKFSEIIEDTEIIAESLGIEAKDDKKVLVTAEGDVSRANIEVLPMTDDKAKTKISIAFEGTELCKSKFSLEYLKKMCSLKLGSEVVLHFAKDYPMKIVYVSDKFSMSFILAPRVSDD